MDSFEKKEFEDIKELKGVFSAIVDFVKELREPITDLIQSLMKAVSGSELGEDVATFYKKLKETGLPEEMALALTKEYLEARLSIIRDLGSMMGKFTSAKKWRSEEISELIRKAKEAKEKSS
ncbi:MAG: hypothetical protein NDF54_09355 [archaeon GB-1867-035]|nr:hypothetical protein [Candidatus Culexmicrobium profundum]